MTTATITSTRHHSTIGSGRTRDGKFAYVTECECGFISGPFVEEATPYRAADLAAWASADHELAVGASRFATHPAGGWSPPIDS